MPSLLTLTTNLKSLQYGKDRPGGGNSGQPYETVPIPGINDTIDPNSEDFLLRGGLNGPKDSLTDIKRLTKFFNDNGSSDGTLFIAKQNLLSRIGVRTQASGVGFNEGAYTPLSTLAQAGISLEGGHIPKQGLIPGRGPNTYLDSISKITGEEESGAGNRLVDLTELKISETTSFSPSALKSNQISDLPTEVLAYGGGPNSLLGIGKTRIPFALNSKGAPLRTGRGNIQLQNSGFFNIPKAPIETSSTLGGQNGSIVQVQTRPVVNTPLILGGFDVFKGGSYTTITSTGKTNTSISDFRQEIYNIKEQKVSYVAGIAPSYNPAEKKTIDGPDGSRINYVSPGQRGDVKNYTKGKIIGGTEQGTGGRVSVVDQINAQPIYQSSGVRETDVAKNDLVKFRIAAINTEKPNLQQFIHFRAFIDSFSDSYNANWNPQKYMGRGEQFYKYDSFSRDISLSFTVAAQSKPEIMEMYRKLNFLASNLAPDYTSAGYLAGPLVQLTMGGWCYELPGFIKSLTLEVPQESTWEIGIDTDGKFDRSVKEMPHICRVTGFTFTPIHKFRPAKQELRFDGPNGDINFYGPERYIALEGGSPLQNNYDDIEKYN